MILQLEFVELMPAQFQEGVLYISMVHSVAIHRCACGCGEKVITPFSPSDWNLSFDGESVTLYPSIGNWNFSCQSHYFITQNKIYWCPEWEEKPILKHKKRKKTFFWEKVIKQLKCIS